MYAVAGVDIFHVATAEAGFHQENTLFVQETIIREGVSLGMVSPVNCHSLHESAIS